MNLIMEELKSVFLAMLLMLGLLHIEKKLNLHVFDQRELNRMTWVTIICLIVLFIIMP